MMVVIDAPVCIGIISGEPFVTVVGTDQKTENAA